MAPHHEVIGRLGLRAPAQLGGRSDVPRELAMLEAGTGRVPDETARRDGRVEEPAAQAWILPGTRRHVLLDVGAQLLPAACPLCPRLQPTPVEAPRAHSI